MTRFVIGPDAALHLARMRAVVPAGHRLLAPTLIRSQWLAHLYAQARHGAVDPDEARMQLAYLQALPLRLLGDRVLQRHAWKIAENLGWPDTFVAEYVALTQLQADAFVCPDQALASALAGVVKVATLDDLLQPA